MRRVGSCAVLLALCAMAVLLAPVSAGELSQVVELTPDNYDTYVNPSRNTFVLFCTSWARECQTVRVVWDRLSLNQLKSRNRDYFVAAYVDAKKYPQLAARAGVKAYPTMIYYTPDEPEGIEYNGNREVALLDSFVFQFS